MKKEDDRVGVQHVFLSLRLLLLLLVLPLAIPVMVNFVIPAAAAAAFVSQSYDFVIVGGGTAGLAVAAR